jgi:hypothetical protein
MTSSSALTTMLCLKAARPVATEKTVVARWPRPHKTGGHARVTQLERECAGVHHRRQAEDRQQVRHDAQRAAHRGQHTGLSALQQRGGHGEDHPGAGNEHHDERGDEEFEGEHWAAFLGCCAWRCDSAT